MLFPELAGARFGYVNLNDFALRWTIREFGASFSSVNPLLHPDACEKMVWASHVEYDIDVSYGGWMENRSYLWRGSYLDKEQLYIHLGIDIAVAAGTLVAFEREETVLHIDSDLSEGGWGTRVVTFDGTWVRIWAHLDSDVNVEVGKIYPAGFRFARIGSSKVNGGWSPHLHVQMMSLETWNAYKVCLHTLDGYGNERELIVLAKRFPDPTPFLRFA